MKQTESSMDPGQISIHKLHEASEKETITKERQHISCWNKAVIKRKFTSSKVRWKGLRSKPIPTTLAALTAWIARESPWKTTRLFSWLYTHNFLQRTFKKVDVEGPTPPWMSKAKGWKMYSLSVKQTYLLVFDISTSSAAEPGMATDPFSILLGARRSIDR